jgi:hypothetical protein
MTEPNIVRKMRYISANCQGQVSSQAMQVILTMQSDEVKAWSLELEARLDRLQPGVCFYPWSKHLE